MELAVIDAYADSCNPHLFLLTCKKHILSKKFAKDLLVFTINRENKQVLLLKHNKLSSHTLPTADWVPRNFKILILSKVIVLCTKSVCTQLVRMLNVSTE